MTVLIAAELLKLRTTRTALGLLAAHIALVGGSLTLVVRNAGRLGAPSIGTADHAVAFLGAGAGASLLLLVVGVLAVTTEHRHGTIGASLLVTPDRRHLLLAKSGAVAAVGIAAALASLIAAAVVGLATGHLGSVALDGEIALGLAGRLLGLPTFAVLGVGLGALIRHQTAAVVVPLLWFLVVESLVPAYGLRTLVPWLPGAAAAALGRDATVPGLLDQWAGALLLLAYVAAAGVAGAWRLDRADIQ